VHTWAICLLWLVMSLSLGAGGALRIWRAVENTPAGQTCRACVCGTFQSHFRTKTQNTAKITLQCGPRPYWRSRMSWQRSCHMLALRQSPKLAAVPDRPSRSLISKRLGFLPRRTRYSFTGLIPASERSTVGIQIVLGCTNT